MSGSIAQTERTPLQGLVAARIDHVRHPTWIKGLAGPGRETPNRRGPRRARRARRRIRHKVVSEVGLRLKPWDQRPERGRIVGPEKRDQQSTPCCSELEKTR